MRDNEWYKLQNTLLRIDAMTFESIDKYARKCKRSGNVSPEIALTIESQWIGLAPEEIKVKELLPIMQNIFSCEIHQPVRQTFYHWFAKHQMRGAYHLTYKKTELLPVVKKILASKFVK
jgi:hypothetical protein